MSTAYRVFSKDPHQDQSIAQTCSSAFDALYELHLVDLWCVSHAIIIVVVFETIYSQI